MYTFEHNPAFDEATFTRLFDDCKAKILEGTIDDNTTELEAKTFCSKVIRSGGATIVCKKDDYVIAMIGGAKKGNGADFTTWVLGRDLSGSKSWLYDSNWVAELTTAMKERYIQVESAHRDGHSADDYSVAMYEQATGLWGASSDQIVRGQGPRHRKQEFKD